MTAAWRAAWRGHALLFDAKPATPYAPGAGLRLLAAVLVLEALVGPRFALAELLGVPVPPPWIRVPVLLVLALALVRYLARVDFAQIGLKPWRDWSAAEKSYFVQVLVLANAVFAIVLAARTPGVGLFATSLAWGFYQELVYRGMLQTELVRRFGAVAGVILANIAFTFGPLHFYHWSQSPRPAAMFAAIFAIGLFFGVLFRRSRNLWMVGIFHGIGDAWMLGTLWR